MIFAGEEYGTGSSRDWAAKGTQLLGIKAVVARSFERIHRSNLVGMGVLPLQFQGSDTWQSLRLTGDELIDVIPDPSCGRKATRRWSSRAPTAAAQELTAARCASTRRSRWTTTATAASCRSCCGSCWRAE